ncbi:MAG: hypothetical protein HN509_16050 [Halobacteriovoraceae bacterium]|jgi:hypothetical protein|nr:hypothetical protein [Halobacteriovoraceae bacterium]MBT5094023.1 hypothetical protein [Halobacteriovoraceae bacterium]
MGYYSTIATALIILLLGQSSFAQEIVAKDGRHKKDPESNHKIMRLKREARKKEFQYNLSKLRLAYVEATETKSKSKLRKTINATKVLLGKQLDNEKKEIRNHISMMKKRLKEIEKNRKKHLKQAEHMLKANDEMMELEALDF